MDRIVFIGNDNEKREPPHHHYVSDKHKNLQISDSPSLLETAQNNHPMYAARGSRILNKNSFNTLIKNESKWF